MHLIELSQHFPCHNERRSRLDIVGVQLRFCDRGSVRNMSIGQERSDNELKMKLCWCPSGEFRMGREHEMGKHQVAVTLTRGFWLGKYEVTQSQYKAVIGENPSRFQGESLPVETLTWSEATEFCRKLTELESKAGRLPEGWEYRLPTEAQWEYACRAGTTTMFSFGDEEGQVGDYAWYADNSFSRTTDAVGRRKANAWGLCDMHGNVWEWCRDAWQSRLPGGKDPEVSAKSSKRVARCGGYYNTATGCRSAMRSSFALDKRGYGELGFRVAVVRVHASGTKASQ